MGRLSLDPAIDVLLRALAGQAQAPALIVAVRRLHDSGKTFDFRFELFSMIDDYLKVLGTKTVEFPAGYHEVLAEAEAVRAAVDRIRSSDVRYREMGNRFGDSADYGHADLLVGRNAPEEVFPLVLDFIEEKD